MTQDINADNTAANKELSSDCWAWLAMYQITIGVLLVSASAFGYSLMQHPALMIPAMMGAGLLFFGARAFMGCRERPLLRRHHHSGNGMRG